MKYSPQKEAPKEELAVDKKNPPFIATKRKKPWVRIELHLLILIGAMLAFIIYKMETEQVIDISNTQTTILKTPAELKQLIEQEKQNPAIYLKNHATIRSNIIGKKIIRGNISNNASVTIYKDITVQLSFFSKTKDTLGKKDFILYETIKPGQNIPYKFKTEAPDSTTQYAINIIKAGSVGN